MRFLDILRRIYVTSLFLEALREALTNLKFLRELLFKKKKLEEGLTKVPMGEVCSAMLRSKSSSKLRDPGSFSIPCVVRDLQIQGALHDVRASLSLMPLFLCGKLRLQDLQPAALTIQLENLSIRRHVGILEDVPV